MLQNLKVDIIYYCTNTDFEMEFNLCGCCRMRLLTDKTNDKKSFVNMLARSVSRSRVIMCCGPLFADKGLIKTVATAIGKGLSLVDNKMFGIDSDEKIEIISGSTPLVTDDGVFGGCIIESGPQTIILLTENKSIRKNLMKTLIHPYIEDLCISNGNTKTKIEAPKDEVNQEPENTEEPEITEEADTAQENEELPKAEEELLPEETVTQSDNSDSGIADVVEPSLSEQTDKKQEAEEQLNDNITDTQNNDETKDVVNTPFEFEENVAFVTNDENKDISSENEEQKEEKLLDYKDDSPDLFTEPMKVKYSKTSYYDIEYKPSKEDELFFSEFDDKEEKDNKTLNASIIIIAVILLLILAILCYMLIIVPKINGMQITEYIKQIFDVSHTVN